MKTTKNTWKSVFFQTQYHIKINHKERPTFVVQKSSPKWIVVLLVASNEIE